MSRNFERRIWEACGGGPIVAAMIAAERLGANQAKVLKYANSGDVTGDRSRVVGYGAVAFVKAAAQAGTRPELFTLARREGTVARDRAEVGRNRGEGAQALRVFRRRAGGADAGARRVRHPEEERRTARLHRLRGCR